MNVCSYHLQEAGATPVQELSYALATAIAVLERVRQSGEVDEKGFANVVGSMSFFVNAGMRFVTELAKMRAFVELWDEITRDRFGVQDPPSAVSATACRSIRSASPSSSRKTTPIAS